MFWKNIIYVCPLKAAKLSPVSTQTQTNRIASGFLIGPSEFTFHRILPEVWGLKSKHASEG